jgi:hypothetical protein
MQLDRSWLQPERLDMMQESICKEQHRVQGVWEPY